jgi:polysaccharide export outer membrane protein
MTENGRQRTEDRGQRTRSRRPSSVVRPLFVLFLFLALWGCYPAPVEIKDDTPFKTIQFESKIPYVTPELLKIYDANLDKEYLIGPGDVLKIGVWMRPDLTGDHVVGPHGLITLPMVGVFKIGGMSRNDAAKAIKKLYRKYYEEPLVTVGITEYKNNKVFVLGRVDHPGIIHFDGAVTLLEALSMAGGLPTEDKSVFLSKCYIVRGRDQIIWVDLLQLLQKADMRINVRLANNDIVYIPDSMDAAVFVMGEIKTPGALPIQTTALTILDAINLSGGPTENANIEEIRLIRKVRHEEGVKTVNLETILAHGDFSQNYVLKDNDIIFLPRKGIAKFNYYLRQIDPLLRTFVSGAVLYDISRPSN